MNFKAQWIQENAICYLNVSFNADTFQHFTFYYLCNQITKSKYSNKHLIGLTEWKKIRRRQTSKPIKKASYILAVLATTYRHIYSVL